MTAKIVVGVCIGLVIAKVIEILPRGGDLWALSIFITPCIVGFSAKLFLDRPTKFLAIYHGLLVFLCVEMLQAYEANPNGYQTSMWKSINNGLGIFAAPASVGFHLCYTYQRFGVTLPALFYLVFCWSIVFIMMKILLDTLRFMGDWVGIASVAVSVCITLVSKLVETLLLAASGSPGFAVSSLGKEDEKKDKEKNGDEKKEDKEDKKSGDKEDKKSEDKEKSTDEKKENQENQGRDEEEEPGTIRSTQA